MQMRQVHWTESKTVAGTQRTLHYKNEKEYYSETRVLFGNPDKDQDEDISTLPAGTHAYPFEFTLPQEIDASFESDYGETVRIRHYCKATIGRL